MLNIDRQVEEDFGEMRSCQEEKERRMMIRNDRKQESKEKDL